MKNNKDKLIQKYIKRGLLLLTLFILLFIALAYFYINKSMQAIDTESEEVVEVTIPTGSTRKNIASILYENDLIKDKRVFEYYIKFKGENNFQAGDYLMSPSMSVSEIIKYLNEGDTPIMEEAVDQIMIPEGVNIKEIAERIDANTEFSETEFIELIEDEEFIQKSVEKYPDLLNDVMEVSDETRYIFEGYLFPATYEIHPATSLEDLVMQMLSKTDSILNPLYGEIDDASLNVHEILTLASYIEREGNSLEDRKLISGVFYNRLRDDMPLQTDLSVLYALDKHSEWVSYEDLKVDSPYNTYKYKGIGAGPINSPSEDAIDAALHPTETDYMYFLADLETGKIYFAETYEKHLEYKEKYLD